MQMDSLVFEWRIVWGYTKGSKCQGKVCLVNQGCYLLFVTLFSEMPPKKCHICLSVVDTFFFSVFHIVRNRSSVGLKWPNKTSENQFPSSNRGWMFSSYSFWLPPLFFSISILFFLLKVPFWLFLIKEHVTAGCQVSTFQRWCAWVLVPLCAVISVVGKVVLSDKLSVKETVAYWKYSHK